MAQRRKRKSRRKRSSSQRRSLRTRAAILLSLCSVSALFALAVLTYSDPTTAVLAYGAAPLAVFAEMREEQSLAVIKPEAAEVVVRKPQTTKPEKEPEKEQPRILIYHTHATEAYLQTEQNPYTPSGSWRTQEQDKNVVAVGARLAEELQETYGIAVIHDKTNHEPPKLSTSYSRSELTMAAYREKYPSIELYIDVHRDAYGNDVTVPTDYLTIDGTEVARLMFVVGTGQGATGTGFGEMPNYETNLALAEQITEMLKTVNTRLAREVRVKTGRYNQHMSDHCLLVEVGHNANTLEQALAAVPYLAKGIAQALENLTLSESESSSVAVWLPVQ